MGSIKEIDSRFYNGWIAKYIGLSKDVDKLPKSYKRGKGELASGSTCLFVDTGELYIYEETSKEWYGIGA